MSAPDLESSGSGFWYRTSRRRLQTRPGAIRRHVPPLPRKGRGPKFFRPPSHHDPSETNEGTDDQLDALRLIAANGPHSAASSRSRRDRIFATLCSRLSSSAILEIAGLAGRLAAGNLADSPDVVCERTRSLHAEPLAAGNLADSPDVVCERTRSLHAEPLAVVTEPPEDE